MSFEPQVMGIMHSTVDATGAGLEVLSQIGAGRSWLTRKRRVVTQYNRPPSQPTVAIGLRGRPDHRRLLAPPSNTFAPWSRNYRTPWALVRRKGI